MKWNSTFPTFSTKQKPPSVRKTCPLRLQSITGQYTKNITHHSDAYGRNVGYSIDASRQNTLSYDPVTSRMIGMNMTEGDFTWNYLAKSNLKSKLTYPNGATAEWMYEPKRNLLTSITNSLRLSDSVINSQVISQYDYTNDAIARRTAMSKSGIMMAEVDTINYGYNPRNEVISADAEQDTDYLFNYTFDDIGNRETGEGKTYTANALNQYTQMDESVVSTNSQPLITNNLAESTAFVPSYDANGNQTLVQTITGIWTVVYNGENRPITWTQDTTAITMEYDYAGRRISYKKMQGDALVSHTKFLYKGYLCVQQFSADTPWNVLKAFIWDPTEPIATRPLCFIEGENTSFYFHDGNKNVTDVISSTPASSDVTHYDYAPFGAVTRTTTATVSTSNSSPITHNSEPRSANPFRFSSEYHDDDLGLIYYNYRHYNPTDGRWINRDPIEEQGGLNLYGFVSNNWQMNDFLGMVCNEDNVGAFKIGDTLSLRVFNAVEDSVSFSIDWSKLNPLKLSIENDNADKFGIVFEKIPLGEDFKKAYERAKPWGILSWFLSSPGRVVTNYEIRISFLCCDCNNGKYEWSSYGVSVDREFTPHLDSVGQGDDANMNPDFFNILDLGSVRDLQKEMENKIFQMGTLMENHCKD